ncbi:MAG: hypothetical protein O3A47_04455 [Chloroflexi bacterium]|nr:hypothetical protein [Chloroflexota bacterium]
MARQSHRAQVNRPPKLALLLTALMALTLLAACSGSGASQTDPKPVEPDTITVSKEITASVLITALKAEPTSQVDSITISPGIVVLDPEESITLSAQAHDRQGRPIIDAEFIWSVVDPRAGAIGPDGKFGAGLSPGTYKGAISVTAVQNTPGGIQHVTTTLAVTIVGEKPESNLASIEILPDKPTVLSGQIFRLRAVGFTEDGLVLPGVSFAWQVRDPELGRINDLGYLTVVGEARTFKDVVNVTGVWQGVKVSKSIDVAVLRTPKADDFLDVQVLPRTVHVDPGDKLQLRAVTLNGLGEIMTGTQLRWSLDEASAGVIDGNGDFVAGEAPGIFTDAVRVEAVLPGEQGILRAVDFASVVIRKGTEDRPLEAVRALPSSIIVSPGNRAILSVHGVDDLGGTASGLVTSWAAAIPNVGKMNANGSFVATGAPGHYPAALVATVEQSLGDDIVVRTASVDVTITGTLTEVEISPTVTTLAPGRTAHFRVTGRDENGVLLTGLVVRWSLYDDRIGTIDAFGNFTAGEELGVFQASIRARVNQTLPIPR